MVVDEVVLNILKSESGLAYSAVTEHHNAVPGFWRNVDNMTIKLMLIIVEEMKTISRTKKAREGPISKYVNHKNPYTSGGYQSCLQVQT